MSAKRKASEAITEPPPPPDEEAPVSIPKPSPKVSGMRPKRHGSRAATVDEVTADMTKDPRRDED